MLYLASRSPRRGQLLEQLGLQFSQLELDVPEQPLPGEPAEDYVSRVAREKAGAGLLQLAAVSGAMVMGADTEVVVDGEVLGKPRDSAEAGRMLGRLSGRSHRVISVVWLLDAGRESHATSVSEVQFGTLNEKDISTYLACGEWQGKAGGYAIQGRAAAFIERLTGSYSGVMGLPLFETAKLLREFGIR